MFYELLFIIPNKYTEDECEKINNSIKDLAKEQNLALIKDGLVGKKKLAYPIKNIYHGYYFAINFTAEERQAIKVLNEKLKMFPEILRHQIVKYNKQLGATKKHRPIAVKDDLEEKIEQSVKKMEEVKIEPKKEEKQEEKPKNKDKEIKIDLNDLDKKLDEFIENVDR